MITFFCYPANAGVQFRNPESGNTEVINLSYELKRSMSGTVRTYKRTPVTSTLSLNFIGLTRSEVFTFRNFIVAAAGLEVRYTDHHGQVWIGNILTEPSTITAIGRDNNSIQIVFEGIKI